jgi:hypothetical protein
VKIMATKRPAAATVLMAVVGETSGAELDPESGFGSAESLSSGESLNNSIRGLLGQK